MVKKCFWLITLVPFLAFQAVPAKAECQEFKKNKDDYKRCLAYLRMAGTPSQRQDAEDQVKKDKAKRRCSYVEPNHILVCGDYETRRERERRAAQKRADQGVDDTPLNPIINRDSGAFGPAPKPSAAGQCRPGRVLSSSGQCVPAGQCRPGRVLNSIGQCVPG
jgi:hypothetical protein